MPLKQCTIDGKDGWKYGDSGTCYPGPEGKKKAIAQAVAINKGDFPSGEQPLSILSQLKQKVELVAEKISFDFDGVLSTRKGQALWIRVGGEYVITARNNSDAVGVYKVTDKLNIPRTKVIFAGSNSNKILEILQKHITTHYDNNPDVIRKLPNNIGKLFRE